MFKIIEFTVGYQKSSEINSSVLLRNSYLVNVFFYDMTGRVRCKQITVGLEVACC